MAEIRKNRTLRSELDILLAAARAFGIDGRVEFSPLIGKDGFCCMITHGRSQVPYPVGHGKDPAKAARACVDDLERIIEANRGGRKRG